MSGAGRWRAFRDIELPLIWPGVSGAATFSFILSFNETVRTALVQGPLNTVQTYIWSTYKQIGLSPTLYALMISADSADRWAIEYRRDNSPSMTSIRCV